MASSLKIVGGVRKIGRTPKDTAAPSNLVDLSLRKRREKTLEIKENQDLPLLRIKNIEICRFNKDNVDKLTVVNITSPEQEGPSTVNDPRMGVMNNSDLCATCKGKDVTCSGHLGRIELAAPIPDPENIRMIVRILRCVCNTCGELLMSEDDIKSLGLDKLNAHDRLSEMEEKSKELSCMKRRNEENTIKCKQNPTFDTGKIKDTLKISAVYKDSTSKAKDAKKEISSEMKFDKIISILETITDETARIMGFSNGVHPRDYIMRYIIVPPPCSRPNVYQDGKVKPDYLTQKLNDLVKINIHLGKLLEEEETEKKRFLEKSKKTTEKANAISEEIERVKRQLASSYLKLIEDRNSKSGSKKPNNTIYDRLQGKEGLIRGNIMGKRVDFSGRTVISPDPNLQFNQIRIPISMAMVLTKRQIVNNINLTYCASLWNKGRITKIFPRNAKAVFLYDEHKDKYLPQLGDIFERWLQDGDYVIFNRQPTLYKYSIQAYEVVIGKEDTIGLHPSSTTPHNADFDGDEGNIHVIQDIEADVELVNIVSAKNCLISYQNFKPSASIIFDGLTSAFLLTREGVWIKESLFYDATSLLTNKDGLRTLEARFKRYNLPYSKLANEENMIEEEEAKLDRKLTKEERKNVIARIKTGTTILVLKEKLDKRKLPEELRKTPKLTEWLKNKINLEFIRDENLKDVLENLFMEISKNEDNLEYEISIPIIEEYLKNSYEKYYNIPSSTINEIKREYDRLKNEYYSEWYKGIIPSLNKYLSYFDDSDKDKMRERYFSEFFERKTYVPYLFSGKALFSALLPDTLSYNHEDVVIIEGVLKTGTITKKHIGVTQNGITQTIAKDFGHERAREFITDASTILEKYITERGFSVGIKDCLPSDSSHKQFINDKIMEAINKVKTMGNEEMNPIEQQDREIKIIGTVDLIKQIGTETITTKISKDNSLYVMAKSGAKGNETNIAQMTGILGQQYTGTTRIIPTLSGGTRCLPYFTRNSVDPQSRGFCTSSLLQGLQPYELFFHQITGRLGSMDTAVSTKVAGELRRKMIKSLEDLRYEYDGTVRNSFGRIFQLNYGADQMDPSKLEAFPSGKKVAISFINPFRLAATLNSRAGFETEYKAQKIESSSSINIDVDFQIENDNDIDYD